MKYVKKTKPALWLSVNGAKPVSASEKQKRVASERMKETARTKRIYNARVKEWLKEKLCRLCFLTTETDAFKTLRETNNPPRIAVQCHHKHGRGWRGELTLVEHLWIPVCAECHGWIHRNPKWSIQLGFLAPTGEWNKMPR